MERRGAVGDWAWCAVAGIMGLLALSGVVGFVAFVAGGRYLAAVQAAGSVLFAYWFGVGAWRRTQWGLLTVDADAMGPVLDATYSRRLILLAAAVPVALALALAVQVVAGRR